jgi:flavin reductase (DIM6/NTAB) family NADH-FMN oxidoreductase RutF
MFFDPRETGMKPAPFRHTVYNALVVPRPIGWISTISTDGVINLAPFSFFNSLSGDPPCVMYCPNGFKTGTKEPKDSLTNVEATGEFVFNMCTYELRDEMNATSAHVPASIDEMEQAGLEAAECVNVRPPRVKASPIALECRYMQTIHLPAAKNGAPNNVVIGEVIGIHIDESVIADGIIDIHKVRPLARLGYLDYAVIEPENIFAINRPD